MDFKSISRLLRNTVTEILDAEIQIDKEHVKEASNILNKFAKLELHDDEVKVFVEDIVRYFVLLNTYMKQFAEVGASQQCTVRMGLGVFLFVIDSTHLCVKIAKKLRKIIDVMTQDNPHNFNIKEFLRVYSHVLDKLSVEVLNDLADKQKSLPTWYQIMKVTGDIETQAIIVEVVLKLFKRNNYMNIDETFLEIVQIIDASSVDKSHMYQNIRMILDQFNEYSANIFSINCTAIKLDSRRVVEYNGGDGDIWLDLNLIQNRLSFFCDHNFLTSKSEIYPTSTTWEVLSLYAKDIQDITFNYDHFVENLKISLTVSSSCVSLLSHTNSCTVHQIEIVVSRESDRFYQFVEHLSKMFTQEFPGDALGIPQKDVNSSITPDISQAGSNSSSPVIVHFEMRKKMSAGDKNSSFCASEGQEDSVVVISDDEDSPTLEPKKKHVNRIGTMNNTLSPRESTHKHNNFRVITKKPKKYSGFRRHNTSNVFDVSVSPLSFTESVFGRRSRPHSRNSEEIENNNFSKTMKISRPKEKRRRMSTVNTSLKMKISSSLSSAVIKPHKNPEADNDNQDQEIITLEELEVEETAMDAPYVDADLNASITKVEHWLKTVGKDAPLPMHDAECAPPAMPEESEDVRELQDVLPSVSERGSNVVSKVPELEYLETGEESVSMAPKSTQEPQNLPGAGVSEKSSSMQPEEKIQLMMGNEENVNVDHDKNSVHGNTVEGLLSILDSQENKRAQDVETREQDSLSVHDSRSLDSDVPLIEVAKIWKRNNKTVKETIDKIETEESEKIINQSFITKDVDIDVEAINPLESIEPKTKDIPSTNHEENVDRFVIKANRRIYDDELDKIETYNAVPVIADVDADDKIQDLEEQQKTHILNDTTNHSSIHPVPKNKRTLYNPNDLSYLNTSLTEYLESKEQGQDTSAIRNSVIQIRSKSFRPKVARKSKTKNNKENKNATKKHSTESKTKIIKNGSLDSTYPLSMTKSLHALKESYRQHKIKNKMEQKLKHKKAFASTSSSSSMEPFGSALKNLRNEKRGSSTVDSNTAKRLKKSSAQEDKSANRSKKVHIISNVLIKPPVMSPRDEPVSSDKYCSPQFVQMTSEFYLRFITQVKDTNPQLLVGDTQSAIVEVLQGCVL